MQNRYHQLISEHWSIFIAIIALPVMMAVTIPILPTFDDWTSLVSPSQEPLFSKERLLFYGYHWRPFDAIFGYIVGLNPQRLFPLLNHICVVTGHFIATILLYKIILSLNIKTTPRNIATLFFLFTPGMAATVTAVDGLNQTYANVWALAATYLYLTNKNNNKNEKSNSKIRFISFSFFILIGTLCKENAIMWTLIPPIIAYGFNIINKQTLKKDLIKGIIIITVYAIAIMILPKQITIHPEYVPEITKTIKGFFKFLLSTWVAVDFISLLHTPSRNLLIATITLLLSLPMSWFLFIRNRQLFKQKTLICLIIALIIAVAPHLLTVFSMMHTYAGLPIAALIIATILHKTPHTLYPSFIILLFSSFIFINTHLWYASYQSGLIGKKMALTAINKTLTYSSLIDPPSIYVITIQDDYPRLSSFCVPPSDAFGWGRAALLYQPSLQIIKDTIIPRNNQSTATAINIAQQKLQTEQANCIWIVNSKNINIIKK